MASRYNPADLPFSYFSEPPLMTTLPMAGRESTELRFDADTGVWTLVDTDNYVMPCGNEGNPMLGSAESDELLESMAETDKLCSPFRLTTGNPMLGSLESDELLETDKL